MKKLLTVVVFLLALSLSLAAESLPAAGSVDVGGFGGVAFLPNGIGAKPVVGTSVGVAIHPIITGFGEFAYTPAANQTEYIYGYRVSAKAKLYDLFGGLRFNIPTGTRVVPYGVFNVGMVRASAKASAAGLSYSESESRFAMGIGGGVQTYLTQALGIRGDARVIKGVDMRTYGRATFGLFFQSRRD